ncbi:MAG: hypothetical protein KF902_05940 [Phycisphaeraceae bacterium]|nr:hypothetical protein [Phycisphaeraceae bacterium]
MDRLVRARGERAHVARARGQRALELLERRAGGCLLVIIPPARTDMLVRDARGVSFGILADTAIPTIVVPDQPG